MAKSGTLTVKVLGDSSHFDKTMKGLGGKAGTAFAAAGAAAGAFGVFSVKTFADFDSKLNESVAIMGDVSDAMRGEMSDAAREVGKTTKFSAAEAAESYFFLASAGMSAEQSIAALPQVAAFAQAGMFDMATATDLATDAQSALGLAVDDPAKNLENLTRVTDVFVKANTLANTSVEQIAEAMTTKAGAAMRSVGMEIEEGSAVLSAFADQGVKGAEAGTQFAIVLRDLQTKALSNSDAFAAAGVSVFDSNGEFRNMADIMGDLEGHLDGMSDAQKKAALATLGFSDKSMGSLQTLLGTSDAIREYEGELRGASGTVKDIADKQMKTFNAQLGLLKDRFMDVAITVGSFLVPKIMQAGKVIADTFRRLLPSIKSALARLGQIMTTTVIPALKSVASFVAGTLVPAMVKFGKWLVDHKPILIGVATAIGVGLVAAFTAWAVSAGAAAVATVAALAPFIAIGTAIAAVVAAVVWAYQNWDIFRDSVDAVASFLKDTVWPILKTGADFIFTKLVPAIIEIAKRFIEIEITVAKKVAEIVGFVIGIPGKISGTVSTMWNGIKTGVSSAAGWVGDRIGDIIGAVKSMPRLISNAAVGMWNGIKDSFGSVLNAIIRGWNNLSFPKFNIPSVSIPGLGSIGGGSIGGWSLPNIKPVSLATGGVVSSPTLALVGDAGRGNPEIVAPEQMLRRIMREEGGGDTYVINASSISDREVARMVRDAIESARRSGV